MKIIERFTSDLSSRRAQHLVYLLHVWICVPMLVLWVIDRRVEKLVGPHAYLNLRIVVGFTLVYLFVRTWLAYVDPPKLKWWLVFPPIDVGVIATILCVTRLGPMSNITLLFFLPIVQASGTLNVRWSVCVGLMVVVGTVASTITANHDMIQAVPTSWIKLLTDDPLNVVFRVVFLMVISSLMTYQALIAAGYREKLGVEADRNRIAMEMHDGVQGHLITIASQLELISRIAENDGKHASEIAQEGRESARQAADELRFLVQRLRNPTFKSGFVAALRQYAHNICERNRLRLVFEVSGEEAIMTPELENALFRIAQESLANIVKHAQARSVTVTIAFVEATARLTVVDDGDGFDLKQAGDGYGLEGMKQRVAENNGDLLIESMPNAGTRIDAAFTIGQIHA